ncbi:MAG TPA: serine hydrolase domain-containing protein [Pyrinomonadaceae bacterium]|nr:serine hydrolase domain-containing protein [Pyrinomonadaceae bacterium]
MKRRTFVGLIAGAALCATGKFTTETQAESKRLDTARMLEVTRVPGVAVAGIRAAGPYQLFAGVARAGGPAVTARTVFPAASLSKPVFAWAVYDLQRQGKIDWNRPLHDYVDLGLEGTARKITALHVLTHSTGLPNWRFQPNLPLASSFEPGSRWQYSGEGFVLLQRVVEKIVGRPIAEYMRTAVLEPLGMTQSTYAWSPEIQNVAASGHDRQGALLERSLAFYERRNYETLQKSNLNPASANYEQIIAAYQQAKQPFLPVALSPNMAGSLQTTIEDYALFLAHILKTVTQSDDFKARVDVNRDIAWAPGWGVDRSSKTPSLFHWGDGPGFKNFCWVEPAKKSALVFFTNGDSGAALYAWLFRQLMNEDPSVFYWI